MNIKRIGQAINRVDRVAPPLADAVTYALFRNLKPRGAVADRERAAHESARTGEIEVSGKRVTTYDWGNGERPVLLVHGWHSRASRFAAFIQPLVDRGLSPVSFDAPANGDSSGRHTTILEYGDAIRQLAAQRGPFRGVIAHSFGALAALDALRMQPVEPRIVTISGVSDFSFLHTAFCRELGLNAHVTDRLRDTIETRLFPGIPDVWSEFNAARATHEVRGRLLVIQSIDDSTVPAWHAQRLADAFGSRVRTELLDGLGHHRILGDPTVVRLASEFMAGPVAPTNRPQSRNRGHLDLRPNGHKLRTG